MCTHPRSDRAGRYRLRLPVQSRNIDALRASGRRVIGRNVGLTSPALQKQLGVDQPDFGVLLDGFDVSAAERIGSTALLRPRIEAEIAFVLAANIDVHITADQAPQYVERVAASFEVVDSRIAGWDISLADTIADNASSGLYVLGDSLLPDDAPDLADISMTMSADGQQVSAGRGSHCLGNPWNALAWLANTSLSYGAPLQAGEVILSGALGPMVAVTPDSTYTASITEWALQQPLSPHDHFTESDRELMKRTKAAVIGSGNIGTDLLIKLKRVAENVEIAVLVGIDPTSDGLARTRRMGISTIDSGVAGLIEHPDFTDIAIIFDSTSAKAHVANEEALHPMANV